MMMNDESLRQFLRQNAPYPQSGEEEKHRLEQAIWASLSFPSTPKKSFRFLNPALRLGAGLMGLGFFLLGYTGGQNFSVNPSIPYSVEERTALTPALSDTIETTLAMPALLGGMEDVE